MPADRLSAPCDPGSLGFATTAELVALDGVIGQPRAVEAIKFGIAVRRPGYNIFVYGPAGTGKRTAVSHLLTAEARGRPEVDDWCYVANYDQPHRPRALRLPTGWGPILAESMDGLLAELLAVLPQAFESDVVAGRRDRLVNEFDARKDALLRDLTQRAKAQSVAVVQGPNGLSVMPLDADANVIPHEAFAALPEERRTAIAAQLQALEDELEATLRQVRAVDVEGTRAVGQLERDVAAAEIDARMAPLRERFKASKEAKDWLSVVAADMVGHLDLFVGRDEGSVDGPRAAAPAPAAIVRDDLALRRYRVNVMVDGSRSVGTPVVVEPLPSLPNLVGRIEQQQVMGALVTDFTLIRPGALHRANGGYLVIEIDGIAQHPLSWEALKRALKTGVIDIGPPGEAASTMTTIILDPEPISLTCKVILIGDTHTYFALHDYDPDFAELFKVGAEFDDEMLRDEDGCRLYARFIASVAARDGLLAIDKAAVARVIQYGSRLIEDQQRLSTEFIAIADLLREADFWARQSGHPVVTAADVERALAAAERRADLTREHVQAQYERRLINLATKGEAVGQVNALTVVSRGQFEFGLPMRVTARVRQGSGEVVDIEREVELGGALHSKGILILWGFLAGRYLPDEQLAVAASVTFEQSYGQVDGDSASSAEAYALLSALSGLPLRQDVAVTGAVSQSGEVQAIGGVNEKIEGFFDVCRIDGLTGTQGVAIPAANLQHLMLRQDVIDAVAAGRFHVWTVDHVDAGIALLTGLPAGERGANGRYPNDTVNAAVERRLAAFSARRRDAGDDPASPSSSSRRGRPRRPAPVDPDDGAEGRQGRG
ncbi:MAG: AAA family ATPase [Ardenticatenales bacterium]